MRRYLLPFSLFLIACSGFGSWPVYLAAMGLLLSLLALDTWKANRRAFLSCLLVAAAILREPSLAYSTSLLAVLLFIAGRKTEAAAILFSHLPLLLSPFIPVAPWIITPWLGGLLFITGELLAGKLPRTGKILISLTVPAYGLALLVATASSWQLSPVHVPQVGPGYQIGAAIEKITGQKQKGTGQLIYNNQTPQQISLTGTLYLDHDARTAWDDGNFCQKRPWGSNTLMAGEPLRMAIRRDGMLISNWGASLNRNTTHTLYALMDGLRPIPLATNDKGHLVLADSDFAVNGMAPFQTSLIRRLTGTDTPLILFHGTCALALLILPWYSRTWFPVMLATLYLLIVSWPREGEIRYVGRHHHWPHTELGEGLARILQDQGINARFGTLNTQILVVGTGHSARVRKEKLIILEPGARVTHQGAVYAAANLPMGTWDGIRDARPILRNGEKLPSPIIREGDITIIATGTPVLLPPQHLRLE